MTEASQDTGVIMALLERMEKQRLPQALELKKRVDQGGLLNDFDITFLKEVFTDATHIVPIMDRHPEYQALAARMIDLYKEIMDKALLFHFLPKLLDRIVIRGVGRKFKDR